MKKLLLVMVLIVAASCEGFLQPRTHAPANALVEQTYVLVGCHSFIATPVYRPVPCTSYIVASSAGTTEEIADSGHLILRRDASADWMLAGKRTVNPCVRSGGSCPSTVATLDSAHGTYQFARDSIVLQLIRPGSSLASKLVFLGLTPEKVTNAWRGPDSLRVSLGNGVYWGVLKP